MITRFPIEPETSRTATRSIAESGSSAAELNRLVVTGIPLDAVTSRHYRPGDLLDARLLRIQGDVQVRKLTLY
jgi:hypothetical protein